MPFSTKVTNNDLIQLREAIEGELYYDDLYKTLYATDASAYREQPIAVVLPKNEKDLVQLVHFAKKHKIGLIPRAAGTSLAGQCVGNGLVVDISKYFTEILEFNPEEKWVKVQPGVIRDQLNDYLRPFGFFFSPITSTANRAMIGGMVGNNSSGTTSIKYGTTREHVLAVETILSDGSIVEFKSIDKELFKEKTKSDGLEGEIYAQINQSLANPTIRENIIKEFPKSTIHRRNTGYAVDYLMHSEPFEASSDISFNFCKLLCGSEGTLALSTAITLHIDRLPPPFPIVIAAHFSSIIESMQATQLVMEFEPYACELMDKTILDCTKGNTTQTKNRFFVEGDPAAILLIECRADHQVSAEKQAERIIDALKHSEKGYAFPMVYPENNHRVWELRSAGLGLLSNIVGDKKATTCIEDTAVALSDLADYIADFEQLLASFGQKSVYYAHAGAGEIHLRPILNLKKAEDIKNFREIALASAKLVKSYQGSLSGEHGDGRLRGEFIPMMVGKKNYDLFKEIKATWDPYNIFNPGKIVDAPAMNTSLRYTPDQETADFPTVLSFSESGGLLQMAEKCTGSGDCRKLAASGGTMCPSYRATKDEKDSTRGRANVLREFLTMNTKENPFNHPEIKTAMDLCLSCKGCTSECPSNVDMASLKAEFLHQYYKSNKIPLSARLIAKLDRMNQIGSKTPRLTNFILSNKLTSRLIKHSLEFSPKRNLPLLSKITFNNFLKSGNNAFKPNGKSKGLVYIFCDEFTNYNDSHIGINTVKLLVGLGFHVKYIKHVESGRAALSKGLLDIAKKRAIENIRAFSQIISSNTPLIGIEPSAILSFRDEYPKLVGGKDIELAKNLAANCLLLDEFLANQYDSGVIKPTQFSTEKLAIKVHGHCHQKALSDVSYTIKALSIPNNYQVEYIEAGCCGMAGSFGYEKEHYTLSMQIGEESLFPAVRKATAETVIVANGTSCRHQIKDGTDVLAKHFAEVLFEALK
jgi:FAD/FMN-containing dehydrogenase/Fe-S oxidoreductase